MLDSHDLDDHPSVIDEVDDAVLASACRPCRSKRRGERLAYAMRVFEQRT
jgi:hypothetical protein